jgi:hypothetical protein
VKNSSKLAEIAREGLEAWRKGDFETINDPGNQ